MVASRSGAAPEVTPAVARERFRAQLLTGPRPPGPVDVVDRLLAVQAQDGRGFRLAVRARSTTATSAALEHCLTSDRSLVVDWLCRGTLHLVRSSDHGWLHALTTPSLRTANRRRLAQEGVSPEQAVTGIGVVEDALRRDGPLTRHQLRSRLDAAGVPTARQAFVHVMVAASLEGICLRGPVVAGEPAFVHAELWLGRRTPVDRVRSLAELARRYLAGHAPATDRDLAAWAGITLGDARLGLEAAGDDITVHEDGWWRPAGAGAAVDETPAPTLLGPFDPVLHGWPQRSWIVGENGAGIVTSNGLFRPIALVDGRAVATWRLAAGVLSRALLPGEVLTRDAAAALDADAARVLAYLGCQPEALQTGRRDAPGHRSDAAAVARRDVPCRDDRALDRPPPASPSSRSWPSRCSCPRVRWPPRQRRPAPRLPASAPRLPASAPRRRASPSAARPRHRPPRSREHVGSRSASPATCARSWWCARRGGAARRAGSCCGSARRAAGASVATAHARLGYGGLVRAAQRRQGTGTTPAGLFPMTETFGRAADPGTAMPYTQAHRRPLVGAGPALGLLQPDASRQPRRLRPAHLRLQRLRAPRAHGRAVRLRRGHRLQPARARSSVADRESSCTRTATARPSGCVSIPRRQMRAVLRWMDPGAHPRIVIGPRHWLARARA